MITPDEIRQKAERKYRPFLRAVVQGEQFFPLEIRFRKAKAGDEYLALREWVGVLLAGSKTERGFGYEVTLAEKKSRRYGRQSLPARIMINTEDDFLRLIGKKKEFAAWKTAVSHTIATFPQLQNWLAQHPHHVQPHIWDELLIVCNYFVAHPRPNVYMREIPVPVHSKFIEDNQAILRRLLDELLPPDVIHVDESRFESRFGLRYDEPQIRMRLLDDTLRDELGWPTADISITLSACAGLMGLNGRLLLIVENKMTFLTLPPLPNSIAIWGKGFQVNLLRDVGWLADCDIQYWGDLDAQGFAILSQLRGYWPQTRSFLMDAATLEKYRDFVVTGTPSPVLELAHLSGEETAVYQQLAAHNQRLEQERISQADVMVALCEFTPYSKSLNPAIPSRSK